MRTSLLIVLLMVAAAFAVGDDERAERVREAAEEVLAARFPDAAHRLEVRVKRVAGEFAPSEALRVVFDADEALPQGTTQIRLFTGSDVAGWTKAGWALLEVAHFDSVLIASTRLPSDEPVPAGALIPAWMETTNLPGEPLTPAAYRSLLHDGAVLTTRPVAEGRALRRSDVRAPYAADVGDSVVMRYRRGALVFALTCKAREAGHQGDEVRLYAPETNRTYRARLTGPGAAEWIETL